MTSISNAIKRPERCYIVNIDENETMTCLFNPVQLAEKITVHWNRKVVPGLPYQVLQYQSTGNRQLPGVEFYMDQILANERSENRSDISQFRDFLRRLTQPSSQGVAPTRALVVWPNLLSMKAVLTELEFRYQQFAADGTVMRYTAVCSFEEAKLLRTIAHQ